MTAPDYIVTGGAGFIGSHLVEALLLRNETVAVIDDLSTGSMANLAAVRAHPNLQIIVSTVSLCPDWERLVPGARGIFHLAAAVGVELVVKSPIRTIETNLRETEAILEIASKYRVPLLLTSTSEVYGKSQKPAFREVDDLLIGPPTLGRWSYACSKLMDEFLALAYTRERGLPTVIARLFNTVGPRQTGQYGMVLPRFITAAKSNQPLRVFGDGSQTRCFCYVADTVEALLRLHSEPRARGEIVNVGGTEEISILDLARKVIELTASTSQIERVPYSEAYTPGFEDMLKRKPAVDKLAELTGFCPKTSLEQIIRKTEPFL